MDHCLASIHICRLRITRLLPTGVVAPGPKNSYVTDKPMQLGVTPVVEAGKDSTLTGGCDCVIATYRGYDKLKRFDLEMDLGVIEPAMLEMLIGATAIVSGGEVIGDWWPTQQFSCASPAQPNVCVEAWQDLWADDHQDQTWPYLHWIWPATYWQIGAHTLQNDFLQPKILGFSRGNTAWGSGPYGQQPEAAQPLGGFFYSTSIPAPSCGYLTAPVT